MISIARRQLITGMGAVFATATIGPVARAAMGPDDKFDLVIKGGEVVDPSQGLRGKRDIGMRYGKIEALEADIPAARAQRVLNAAGRIVVPGLIDLHAHVFTTGIGIPADELVLHQGTTTAVSAGDAGASTFATYRRYADVELAHAASSPSCTSPTSACRRSRSGSCSTSTSRRRKPRRGRSRRTPTSPSASRCACRRT